MRKTILLPAFAALGCLIVPVGCGDSNQDLKQQQAKANGALTQILTAASKKDVKAYCALTFRPGQADAKWQAACIKAGISPKLAKAAQAALKNRQALQLSVQNNQANTTIAGIGTVQLQPNGGQWKLNTVPVVVQDVAKIQQTQIRDRTRFYLATVMNGDANAYCVVADKSGESVKDCVSRVKAWVKDKNGDYKQTKELATKQIKSIDKAKIDIKGKQATVQTDPKSIKVTADGPGNSWMIQGSN